MKIAIINDIHLGKPLIRDNIMRAASHLANDSLPQIFDYVVKQHAPDVVINLGDLIRSQSKELDLEHYRQALNHFNKFSCPVIHLIGNHDIKTIATQEIENLWREAGFDQKSYGLKELQKSCIIWLGMEVQPENHYKHKLPQDQLIWLEEKLTMIQKPIIIFTHCAIDDQNVDGNFFYEGYESKHRRGFFLENYSDIQKIISNHQSIVCVVQAHLHYFHTKMIAGIPYVTCPAMSDNICGPNVSNHIPEIYSILSLCENQLTLKAFSREYCFAGMEFERKMPPLGNVER